EIDVATGDAEDAAEILIGHLAEEMHPVPVNAIAQLGLHLAAQARGVAALDAVRGLVAANHQDPRLGALGQDLGQGAHHDMEAPGALHIARHIGDDLILAGQRLVQPPQANRSLRVG
ncbi:hypothetical protein TW82_20820, partial [Pseudoalteromonas fuliginea]